MSFGFSFGILTGRFAEDMAELDKPIAKAATGAMDDVASVVKTHSRSDIERAGFSKRWQNALRVDKFPSGNKLSDSPAVYLHHKIQYAGVFEDGAFIRGKPLLWVPLTGTPPKIGGNLMTVARFTRSIGPLVSMGHDPNKPLLGAPIRLSRSQAAADRPKVTLAALKRGKEGVGILRTIPLFFGIKTANIHKQLNIRQICAKARDRIPEFYAKHFEG